MHHASLSLCVCPSRDPVRLGSSLSTLHLGFCALNKGSTPSPSNHAPRVPTFPAWLETVPQSPMKQTALMLGFQVSKLQGVWGWKQLDGVWGTPVFPAGFLSPKPHTSMPYLFSPEHLMAEGTGRAAFYLHGPFWRPSEEVHR